MSTRFFAEQPITTDRFLLIGEQAHHVTNVMRLGVGDRLVLFDGTGAEFQAKLVAIHKRQIDLEIVSKDLVSREISTKVMVAVALPKGDRQKFMVEKLVELGCAELIPLKTSRSVADANAKVVQRLGRQIIEASKQCGRNVLMEVARQHSIEELLVRYDNTSAGRVLADPTVENKICDWDIPSEVVIAIGPEGGFSDDEQELFVTRGWDRLRLGPTVLRIETAAIAAMAMLGLR